MLSVASVHETRDGNLPLRYIDKQQCKGLKSVSVYILPWSNSSADAEYLYAIPRTFEPMCETWDALKIPHWTGPRSVFKTKSFCKKPFRTRMYDPRISVNMLLISDIHHLHGEPLCPMFSALYIGYPSHPSEEFVLGDMAVFLDVSRWYVNVVNVCDSCRQRKAVLWKLHALFFGVCSSSILSFCSTAMV